MAQCYQSPGEYNKSDSGRSCEKLNAFIVDVDMSDVRFRLSRHVRLTESELTCARLLER